MMHKFLVQIDDNGQLNGVSLAENFTDWLKILLNHHFKAHQGSRHFSVYIIREEREPEICQSLIGRTPFRPVGSKKCGCGGVCDSKHPCPMEYNT